VNDVEHSLFMALRMVIVAYNLWNKTPESIFSDYTRPVRDFRSPQVSLLLLFMGKIRGKDKISLHCSQSCRYSVVQSC